MKKEPVKLTTCRSTTCGASVLWVQKWADDTHDRMLVDATPEAIARAEAGLPFARNLPGLVSHFVTCKDADRWRGKAKTESKLPFE